MKHIICEQPLRQQNYIHIGEILLNNNLQFPTDLRNILHDDLLRTARGLWRYRCKLHDGRFPGGGHHCNSCN